MARTSAAAVKLVLRLGSQGGDYDDANSPDLTPFIDAASAMVDDAVTCASDRDITIDSTRAELIERWLAAHFYATSDKTYQSKSTEGASASFTGQTAMYLESTLYGQHAMRLDKSGCLSAAGGAERKTARAKWLGKRPSLQTDYVDMD